LAQSIAQSVAQSQNISRAASVVKSDLDDDNLAENAAADLLKEEEDMKPLLVGNGVKCCSFALTFKSDQRTDCWLLY